MGETERTLKDILDEELARKGSTIERLAQQTSIAERHLNALFQGEFKRLPAAPYVRGYLSKIARALDLNEQELWQRYRTEVDVRISGPLDRLPANRYAIKRIERKWIFSGAALILLLVYLGFNIRRHLGEPEIRITNPAADTMVVDTPLILLKGEVDSQDKLTIGDEEIALEANGGFEKNYPLEPGLNTIQFTAKRLLGKEITVTRQVIYQP